MQSSNYATAGLLGLPGKSEDGVFGDEGNSRILLLAFNARILCREGNHREWSASILINNSTWRRVCTSADLVQFKSSFEPR